MSTLQEARLLLERIREMGVHDPAQVVHTIMPQYTTHVQVVHIAIPFCHVTVAAILERSMSTLQEGRLLLQRIHELGVHDPAQVVHIIIPRRATLCK